MRCHGDVESASVADGSQSRPLPAGSAAHARRKRFRAGTVLRNGPQAHGSRANRATTATPVTTRACRTSAANHGCLVSCALELIGKGRSDVNGVAEEDFMHRAVVTGEVTNETLDNSGPQAIAFAEGQHIEQVPWMLAVERRHELAAIELVGMEQGKRQVC